MVLGREEGEKHAKFIRTVKDWLTRGDNRGRRLSHGGEGGANQPESKLKVKSHASHKR